MNGVLRTATLVPPAGLIPLGFALLMPLIRLVPVAVAVPDVVRRPTGPS